MYVDRPWFGSYSRIESPLAREFLESGLRERDHRPAQVRRLSVLDHLCLPCGPAIAHSSPRSSLISQYPVHQSNQLLGTSDETNKLPEGVFGHSHEVTALLILCAAAPSSIHPHLLHVRRPPSAPPPPRPPPLPARYAGRPSDAHTRPPHPLFSTAA